MAWQTEMVTMLRRLVEEIGVCGTYDQDDLEEIILVAGQFVQTENLFNNSYTIDVDQLTFSPDPTEGTKDNNFINLTVLKAACIIDKNEARLAAGRAFSFTDAGARVDLKGVLDGKLAMLKHGWCQEYEQAKMEYALTNMTNSAQAVLAPFRADSAGLDAVDFR